MDITGGERSTTPPTTTTAQPQQGVGGGVSAGQQQGVGGGVGAGQQQQENPPQAFIFKESENNNVLMNYNSYFCLLYGLYDDKPIFTFFGI